MASFEEQLAAATARGANVVPGVVLSAIDSTGARIYDKASGYHSVAPDAPEISRDGTFWIASCTKLLSSISALQCIERGLIGASEPVGKILPELAAPQIASLDEAGELVLTPAKNAVTLSTLLTHSSGNAYQWLNPAIDAWRKKEGSNVDELRLDNAKLYSTPLNFEPGEGWAYGGGCDWGAILAARLHDQTVEQYMEANIWKPLGMTSTTFHTDRRPDIKERLVGMSARQEDGTLKEAEMPFPSVIPDAGESGGGGITCSVDDYMKVLADLISPTPKILKVETIEKFVFARHLTDAARNKLSESSFGKFMGVADDAADYSLAGMYIDGEGGLVPKGTVCWGGFPNLKWMANREKGFAAMYASQVIPPGDEKSAELAAAFYKEAVRLAAAK
ncbi:beta-lactamase/transpeptidase-like protein [Aulographum hederae CBS 113979]|uniref:Beta-lactamase/transpeptidase-like protein n=1 Tax=Aulographum hederae CBS 113979 TaxID=1176131 RepID=A0A6G1GNL3_9PEZI|nr:beta-lactamase/transpeptidase-like protein [Aulographum hederae CBS 113979]